MDITHKKTEKNFILFDEKSRVFHLRNTFLSYLIKIEESNVLAHIYFGKPVKQYKDNKNYPRRDRGFSGNIPLNPDRSLSKDTLPQEYSSHGSMDFRTPASIIQRKNGSDLLDLRYDSHYITDGKPDIEGLPQTYVLDKSEAQTLVISLKDRETAIYFDLFYTIFSDRAVITRSVKIRNETRETIKLEKAASFQLDFAHTRRFDEVIALPGAHVNERQISRQSLLSGTKVFESRRGTSSHHMNNFIALVHHHTTENTGEAIGLQFVYSGNHSFELEKDQINQLIVVGGINSHCFSWELNANQSFQTPEMILSYSSQGLNKMSQIHHELLRERIARGRHQFAERPILVNNWEATYFDFNSEKIKAIIDEAKELGIEMFVLDDGWFGKRDADNSSLGDWFEYKGKLTNGLREIADYAHSKGLKFGLWFEPEMISIDSELYRTHPDFLMQVPGRMPSASRSQHVLDFTRLDVRQTIEKQMRKILDTIPLDYIKWDMNRSLSDIYSITLDPLRQGEVAHRYMLGLYELLEHLTADYPEILWEGCSGGGGRFDAGFIYYMPQSWTSDNTDAVERMKIQYGTSLAYPISSITAHVSAVPNHQTGRSTSLKTRGETAMSAVFGYELDLTKLSPEEKKQVKEQIISYQTIRPVIQYGHYYRLASPFEENIVAWMFVSPKQDEAIVFLGRILASAQPTFHEVYLLGLDDEALYQEQTSKRLFSGAELMTVGLYFPDFQGDFQTELLHFKKL
ncbi:TPA: alpha-galactosidase [Enterococcus faecium]|nr:alpha-galactosidase [Enterococcus faecium]HAQ4671914.1 alpha-galactosidase [Enterococcus faecium]HAQ4705982.1 alpha-galactosidase [Enterococcus faecium]HAQ5980016.1 alpha-galactosidase [Enterococcus faecium]HAR1638330.1 alpha-galactosidase [Enterococcus faecium]